MAAKLKLPKVTRYVANVGKSLAFATIDAVSENTSGIKDFIETNNDIFRESYSGAKNYRQTARNAAKSIKQSNLYQAIKVGARNLGEDLKSGKFYNERDYSDQVLGLDEGFGDDDLDFSWDNESVDDGTKATIASTNAMSDRLDQSIGAAAMSTNSTVAKGVRLVTQSNEASTQLMMAQMDRSASIISSSMGSVYTAVDSVNKFLNGPLVSHMENSRKYYEASLRSLEETQGMMKEMLEMQRNLYKAQQEAAKPSKLDQSFTAGGGIDIAGYFKNVKGNIGNLMSEYGIGGFDLGGGNPFMAFAAAPMKIFTSFMIDNIMSKDFKKSLKSFDKGLTSMFSQFVARMNTKKNDVSGGLWDIVASIFGIDIAKKDNIDPSKYKKDAVPFDGITRQAIIETIPGYLARIEAALTGNDERYYDYQGGTWKGARRIAKEYDAVETSAIANANSSIKSDIQPLIDQLKAINEGQARSMSKSVDRMIMQIYKDGGDFRPNDPDAWKHYGFKSKRDFDLAYGRMSRTTVRDIAKSNMDARQRVSNARLAEEANGGISRQLYNGAFEMDPSGKGKRVDYTGLAKGSGWLSLSKDEQGHNVFHYLREILNAITLKHNKKNKNRCYANTRTPSSHREGGSRRSGSESSDDSGGDPDPASDDDGPLGDDVWESLKADEAARAASGTKKKGLGDWVRDKMGNSPIGKLFGKMLGGAADIVSKPLNYVTKLINKADESMFKMMFGTLDLKDKDGNKVESVFQYITMKVKDTFADIGNWFKEQFKNVKNTISDFFKEKIKPLWEKYGKPVKDQVFGMAKKGFGRFKEGVGNTFGRAYDTVKTRMKKGEVVPTGEVVEAAKSGEDVVDTNARGTYATKRGLTMVSPGEMIIPASFDPREQQAMEALERRDRRRIINAIGLNAKGTVNTDQMKANLRKIMEENKGKGARTAASGILGGAAGLLTGFNPLLGAMAGAGISIIESSDTLKTALFGKEMEDGTYKKGLMPKGLVDMFKKSGKDMTDLGIAGGLLGLVTPLGPLGGAIIGSSIGFLKNNEKFKEFVFGDKDGKGGFLKKESFDKFKKHLKKAAPSMLIGAGAGILMGPFGLLGNAIMGAGVGLLSSTSAFHKFVFGDPDDPKKGSLVGAMKRGILEPAKEKINEILEGFKGYAKKHLLEPLKNFWEPFKQGLKNMITSIGDGVKDAFNRVAEKYLGIPIHDFLQEKVFKPMTKLFFNILKFPLKIAKVAVAAPFKALGAIGNSMRMGQINKGKARDMTAQERLDFRKKHGVRNYFSKVRGADKMQKQDEYLANASLEELQAMSAQAGGTLEGRQTASKAVVEARGALGREISAFFNETNPDGTLRYDVTKFKYVKKIARAGADGDLEEMHRLIDAEPNLTPVEKADLKQRLGAKVEAAEGANAELKKANADLKKGNKGLSKILGHKVKDKKGLRDVKRSVDAEIALRTKAAEKEKKKKESDAAAAAAADEAFKKEHPAEAAILDATKQQTDVVSQQFQSANSKIDEIIKLIKIQLDPTGEAEKTTPPGNEEGQQKGVPQLTDGKSGVPATIEAPKGPASSEIAKIADAAGEKAEKEEAQQDVIAAEAAGVDGSAKPTLVQRMLNKAKGSKVGQAVTGFASKFIPHHDEDSKEATEARQAAEQEEAEEDENDANTRESATWLQRIGEGLGFGKKKKGKDDEEGGGFLGKIFGGIGKGIKGIFSFLTGGLGTTAGKIALAAGGLSLLGWGSEWIKTSVWPKLKSFLFGEKDADGNVVKNGLLGGLGDKMKQIFLGTGGVVEKIGGFFTKIKDWYEGKGGISGILVNDVVPKIIAGWGLAMDNIVTPLVAILIKNLPSMFLGLVKGVINGIKIAVLNKGIVREKNTTIDTGNALKELNGGVANSNAMYNALGDAKGSVKNMFSTAKSSAAYTANKAAEINYGSLFGVNDAKADETYDANGNKLNKSGQDIMYEDGFLGSKKSTNQLYYDENGNIAIDQYDTWNTTDSLASKGAKVAGRGFLHGLLGRKNPIFTALGKISGKGIGKGTAKVVTGGMGKAAKWSGKIFGGSNKLGQKLNSWMTNTPVYTADEVAKAFGTSADDIAKAMGKKAGYSADDIAKAFGSNVDDVGKFMAKNADDVVEGAAKSATKSKGVLSKIKDKIFGKAGKEAAETAATKTGSKVAKEVVEETAEKVVKNADDVAKHGPKIIAKIKNFFTEIAGNSKIIGFIKKACKKAGTDDGVIKKALSAIADKIGKVATKIGKSGVGKLAGKLAKCIPYLNIALYVADFLWGYNNADTILGVAKGDESFKVGFGHKVLCGLLHLITTNLTFGLVPTETLVDIIVEFLFPLFGLSADELMAARERADDIMDAWNEAHPDDTYTNLEDFNNKDKWWFKAKKAVKGALGKAGTWIKDTAGKAWSGIKSGASTAWEWAKEKASNVWEGVTSFFSNVGSTFGKLFDGFKDTFSAIGKGIGKVLSFAWKGDLKGAYKYSVEENKESPVTSKIANIILGIGKVFYTPVILITSLVGKIKDVFVKLFDAAKQVIPAVGQGMADTFKGAWKGEFCKGQIKSTGNEMLDKVSNAILFVGKIVTLPVQFGAFLIGKVVGAVKKVIDAAKNVLPNVGQGMADTLKKAWNGEFCQGQIKPTGNDMLDKVSEAILTVGKIVTLPVQFGAFAIGSVVRGVKKVIDVAKEIVPNIASGTGQLFAAAWKGEDADVQLKSTDNDLLDKIQNVVFGIVKVVTFVPRTLTYAVGRVVDGVKAVINAAKVIVPNVAKGTGQLFKDAWKGEDNGGELESTGNDLLDKIQNVVFGIVKVVTFVPRTLTYAVGRVVDGVKAVIDAAKKIIPNVATGTKNLFVSAWKGEDNNSTLPSTGNDLLDKIQNVVFGIVKVVTFVPRTLTYAVGRVVDAVKSVINAAKLIIPNIAKGTGDLFVSAWKGQENNSELPSTGNELLDKIQGGIFGVVKVMTFVPRTLTYAVGRVVDAVKSVINAAKLIIPNVAKGTGQLFVDAWKGQENNSELPSTGNELLDKIQGGIFGVVKVMTFVPRTLTYAVGRVVDAVKAVIDGSKKIIPNIATGTGNLFKDAWKGEDNDRTLPSTGTDLLDKIQNGIFGVVKVITFIPRTLTYAVGRVVDAVKTVIDGAKKIIPNILSGTGNLFTSAWKGEESDESLPTTGVDLLDKIQNVIFGVVKVVMFVPRTLTYAVGRVVDTVKGFIDGSKLIFPKVGSAFGTLFTKAWAGEELPSKVESTGNSTCDTIANVIFNIGKVLMTPVTLVIQAIGKIKEGITTAIQKVKDGFTFKDLTSGITEAASNLGEKIKSGISGAWDKISGAFSSAWDTVKGWFSSNASDDAAKMRAHYGLGHKYQSGPELAGMPYGDSTIGKAGCGPVAATNAINRLRGAGSMSVRKAADYAEDKGMTIPGGGTDIGYFKSFLNSQNIDATNTTNRGAIMEALKNGQQVIMLGQDKTNKHGATFGTTPHFVTAIGLDANGNIVVEDPDMPQSSLVYKKDKVLNSMMTSTIVSGKGRGRYGLGDGENGEEEGRKTSFNALMSSFGSLTSSLVKSMFGEDAYNAISGSTSEAEFENPEIAAKLWKYLRSKGFSEHGAAGIMGNIYNSSKFKTANLEDSKEEDLGTDVGYTYMVDRGQKTREQFATDGSGYGMTMWHSANRKRKLYDATVKKGASIGDLDAQMKFLVDNMKSERSSLYSALRGSTDHAAASDAYLKQYHMDDKTDESLDYETPKGYAATIYDTYHGSAHNADFKKNAGRARDALNSYETEDARTSRIMTSAGRANAMAKTVDYATFLQTIVTLLMNISDNSALLVKILDILSSKFNIDIDPEEVNKAANQGKARTERALADLIKKGGGDAGSVSKMLNGSDNEYILTAMAAIAKE